MKSTNMSKLLGMRRIGYAFALAIGASVLSTSFVFADSVGIRSAIFGAILEKISTKTPEHAAALRAINDAIVAGAAEDAAADIDDTNEDEGNTKGSGPTAGDGGDGGDGEIGPTIIVPGSAANSGGAGNGGGGGSSAAGGLIRAGSVLSNSTAVNTINAVIIRIGF